MDNVAILMQAPGPGEFLNLYKIGLVFLFFVGWVFAIQWIDRDADHVKTRRERWNLIAISGGLGGFAVLMLIPWAGNTYFLGLGFWLLLAGGSQMAYILHRNGRVVPERQLLTPGHARRLFAREKKADTEKLDRGQRVHLGNHEGESIARPQDRHEFAKYTLTQDFLFDVLWRRASDAEVLIGKESARVVYRIDGVTAERADTLSLEDVEMLVPYLKELAGLNPEEIRRPQEGNVFGALLAQTGELGRINVITSGSRSGERLRLKVQQPASRKKIQDLGFAPQRLEQIKQIAALPAGLVLLTGGKGSGITTTQYAVLKCHDAFMQNIHTLQRSSLYELDNITQTRYEGEAEGTSFARQLQSALRREPDIVGVGECTDRETAQIALRAAVSDRKIYMAMEAKSTLDALARILAFAEDNKLVANGVAAIVNQRLIRVLCNSCRQSFKPDESLLKKANLPLDKIEHFHRPPTEAVFDRKGREIVCQTCQGSGYVGRVGVFELLVVDDKIRQLIAEGAQLKQIKSQARKNRMHYMQEEGLLKVIDGTTSLDEVIRGLRDDTK